MSNLNKKISAFVLLLILAIFIGSLSIKKSQAATTSLSGWAWSSNIGWISFNSTDLGAGGGPYAVTISTSTGQTVGTLNGFAWSPNIGWVKFGGLSAFPVGVSTVSDNAKINISTGALTGWARACAGTIDGQCGTMTDRTDGWDGWISLSGKANDNSSYGLNLNLSTNAFSGYAWDSIVLGWIDFSRVCVGTCTQTQNAPTCSLTVSPISLPEGGGNVTVTWTSTGADSCQGEGFSTGAGNPSSNSTGVTQNIGQSTNLNLSCKVGTNTPVLCSSKTVTVATPPSTVTCSQPANTNICPNTLTTGIPAGSPSSITSVPCISTAGNQLYCEYTCRSGYTLKSGSCSRTTIEEQ